MNKSEKIEKRLSELDFPEIKLVGYQARLKSSLLASKRSGLNNNFNFLSMIKQAKFSIPAMLVLIVVAVFCFSLAPKFNKTGIAQAKELIAESQFAITQLSQEARAQLEELIKADLSKTLEEAYNANDLEYVGEDDLTARGQGDTDDLQVHFLDQETGTASQDGEIKTVTSVVPNDKDSSGTDSNVKMVFGKYIADYNANMMTKVKILKYTDKDGNKIVLGLNSDNLPVMQIKVSEK